MSDWLCCDTCEKLGRKPAYGWKTVEPVGGEFRSFDEKPVEHVCDTCWATMLAAVRGS